MKETIVRVVAYSDHLSDATDWCFDNFGVDSWYPGHETWTCNYIGLADKGSEVIYKFANPNHALEFALRWQ